MLVLFICLVSLLVVRNQLQIDGRKFTKPNSSITLNAIGHMEE